MQSKSYVQGRWVEGRGGKTVRNAITGEPVAQVSSDGLDFAGMLRYAREQVGPGLRALTFHQRATQLKNLGKVLMEQKERFYALSAATGATRTDSWVDIDGGIGTLFSYASKGKRELPNATFVLDGGAEAISRHGTFIGQHVCTPLEGVAFHINAFNFPCWGMMEKFGANYLAGLPAIVKPATQTAYVTEEIVRAIVDSGCIAAGALQLVSGGVGDLLDHVTCQDVVTFTGSGATGLKLKQHPAIVRHATRFSMEADSLNFLALGPDAGPGTPEFALAVKEVAREMTVKAGQKCTAIRRAIVPRALQRAFTDALAQELNKVVVGDPAVAGVTMGALASRDQVAEVRERVAELQAAGATIAYGDPDRCDVTGADAQAGAFFAPLVLASNDPFAHLALHAIEAFGPVSTVMPYDSTEQAIALAHLGNGSLVGSVVTHDRAFARAMVLGCAPFHGRLLLLDRDCAKESTGHGAPLPMLVHGGPGRAGGGEELGGVRSVFHYLQRTALQGSPDMLTSVLGYWLPGAERRASDVHPFRKNFDQLEIGDTLVTGSRVITLEDIEHFAYFTGDTFYAHMDEAAAKANPFFGGRVAHGYYIVSLAAGLFVDPAPGPVLANYGIDNLRFVTPARPGDALKVTLTCKQKSKRENAEYGEVRWDTTVTNQENKVVAQYDVLTLVATQAWRPKAAA
jgi:oxepin-CoA hydrolase/3-oxo-5,6-dehydrosuberyl-CoA semialdehyde dehydrogenase